MNEHATMEKVVNLCKRRGFIFPSSEIYGGIGSTWDYGPVGVELKRNVKEAWWKAVVTGRNDTVGLDASILMHPRVWEASGHVAGFSDPLVECKECHHRFREDFLEEAGKCPDCGGEVTEARQFNLMFKTFMGPVEDTASTVFLRPETAQGIFVNFTNVPRHRAPEDPLRHRPDRQELPQRDHPGQLHLPHPRVRADGDRVLRQAGRGRGGVPVLAGCAHAVVRGQRHPRRKPAPPPHGSDELAHYAKACVDVEYEFPFGWSELEGIANRSDFDLKQHMEYSGKDMTYFDETTRSRYVPYVIEPSAGVDRPLLAFLVDAYDEEEVAGERRAVLRLDPRLAPFKAGVYPLLRKDGQPERAQEIRDILKEHFPVVYDQAGSIGRRYRRQDEIGTPFGVTVDHETMTDQTVTLRDRDAMTQVRIPVDRLVEEIRRRIDPRTRDR